MISKKKGREGLSPDEFISKGSVIREMHQGVTAQFQEAVRLEVKAMKRKITNEEMVTIQTILNMRTLTMSQLIKAAYIFQKTPKIIFEGSDDAK